MAGEPLLRRSLAGLVWVEDTTPGIASEGVDDTALATLAETSLTLAKAADIPVLELRDSILESILSSDNISSGVAQLKRRVLIVCGGLLEGAVTQIALSALVDGFDVFIGADLVWTAEPGREPLFFDRITHCCGHVLTRRQILLELLAQEKDEGRRERLKGLLGGAAG